MRFTRSSLLLLVPTLLALSGFATTEHNREETGRQHFDRPRQPQQDFVEPKVMKRVEASYADKTRESGIRGSVVVEMSVNEFGNVESARALTGSRILRPKAVEAARQWNFEPARLNGKPVKAVGAITFCFSVDSPISTSRYTFAFGRCCPGSLKAAKKPCPDPTLQRNQPGERSGFTLRHLEKGYREN